MMVATNQGKKSLDIPKTLEEHSHMIGNALGHHVV